MHIGVELSSPVMHHTKKCTACGVDKLIEKFAKHKTGKYFVAAMCKQCKSSYRKNYYQANKEKSLIQSAEWSKNNLHKKREYRAKRRANILMATPQWVDNKAIKRIYAEADFLTKATGIKYEVDHIIPLQGKNVCGLHVASNLQVIKMVANRSKATKFKDMV